MKKTILFIHGMFQNSKSWGNWVTFFNEHGYDTLAPSWPDHEGEPESLRRNPPATLGDLRLEEVISKIEGIIAGLPEKPIVIGHSVGGLIVQRLANKGLISMGIPISSVAPNDMLTFDWQFFKNATKITNPFKGDDPILMTSEDFHNAFANTLSATAAKAAFEKTATHDSRNVLRDCLLGPGHVDLSIPHVPLLFVAGDKDHIIPHELVEKNSKAYEDESSISAYKQFPERSHFICGEPGWEEVATHVANWIYLHSRQTELQVSL